jgi:hypothetical protein
MGDVVQASKKRLQYSVQRFCGRVMTTTANCGNAFNEREADSPKSWSRVIKQRKPLEQAAATSSPLDRAFHPRRATVSQGMPRWVNRGARCTSTLASSSHVN